MIVPTRRAANGAQVLALPKGHPDGPRPRGRALREVREETGVEADASVEKLGDVRYWYQRDGAADHQDRGVLPARLRLRRARRPRARGRGARWIALDGGGPALTYKGERDRPPPCRAPGSG